MSEEVDLAHAAKVAATIEQLEATTPPGRVLEGVTIDETAPIQKCKVYPALIWFGRTAAGKACPFDVVDGQRTAVTHFSTCPNVRRFAKERH